MSEDLLKRAKKEYLETPIPDYLKYDGWRDVRIRLESRGWGLWALVFKRGLIFAVFALLVLGSVVGVAQAAKPGDKLYTVKVLADKVFARVSGNYEVKIQRRAADVIEVSKNNESTRAAIQANDEYQKALDEARVKTVDPGKREDLKKILQKEEDRFKKEADGDSKKQEKLNDVIEQTQKAEDEIQKINSPGT